MAAAMGTKNGIFQPHDQCCLMQAATNPDSALANREGTNRTEGKDRMVLKQMKHEQLNSLV